MKNENRIIGLDVFRVLMAFIVLLFHSVIHLNCNYGILQSFITMGAIMMSAFFILSGYILYSKYFNKHFEKIEDIVSFYKKRFISIMPIYYAILIIFLIMKGTLFTKESIMLFPIEILGVQMFFTSLFPIEPNDGLWFISCMIFCYIVFPFAKNIMNQMQTKNILVFSTIILVILLYSPFIVNYFTLFNIYSNIFFRIIEFLLGMILSHICNKKDLKIKKSYIGFFLFLILIVLISILYKINFYQNDYMIYNIVNIPLFLLMIPFFEKIKFKYYFTEKVIRYLAKISYSYFLGQLFLFPFLKKIIEYNSIFNNNITKISLSIIFSLIFGILIYEIIEKNLKKLFYKKFLK